MMEIQTKSVIYMMQFLIITVLMIVIVLNIGSRLEHLFCYFLHLHGRNTVMLNLNLLEKFLTVKISANLLVCKFIFMHYVFCIFQIVHLNLFKLGKKKTLRGYLVRKWKCSPCFFCCKIATKAAKI